MHFSLYNSCKASVPFKDYEMVFQEIQDSISSHKNKEAQRLRYLSGPRSMFAGNFSSKSRKSFFTLNEEHREIPCGFMKEFVVDRSDYDDVFDEIQDSIINASKYEEAQGLRYLSGPRSTFAGNFSSKLRRSFFSFSEGHGEIPCGFLKEFIVGNSDRVAMDNCRGVVVVSGVFNNYDKIRQPIGLASKSLQTVCFFLFADDTTIKELQNHAIKFNATEEKRIGVWRIVTVLKKHPYKNPAMNGKIVKHLVHRLFPNAQYSIWVDSKLQMTVDPLLLLHSLLISENADLAISRHPFSTHTMEEAMAIARWGKWRDIESLRMQMETYCEYGLQAWSPKKLPYTTDVPDSALVLKRHGIRSNLFSCLLFNELEAFTPRDQIVFAYVRDLMEPRIKINMFEKAVFEQVTKQYRHINQGRSFLKLRMASIKDINGSKCENYLKEMWANSHNNTESQE